jgi:formylglycine-generating enzyme required for sulfatase activity
VRLIFADWLDEHNRSEEAELMRLHVALLATCCDPDNHPERVRQQARIVELLAAGVRPCLPRRTVALAKGVDITFAWIAPGTFLMGSPSEEPERDEDETLHEVTLAQGFYRGIHAVTQAQWQAMMGNNPSRFKGKKRPVEEVFWEDCQAFCAKLSLGKGRQFRLPSEAEWEYSCRAGTTTPFFFGATLFTDQSNYDGNYPYGEGAKGVYRKRTTSVGNFPANAWGLFDLHGNVWEWCQDEYKRYEEPQTKNASETENMVNVIRVLRGGSWASDAWICRAAFHLRDTPDLRSDDGGFRVAFGLD